MGDEATETHPPPAKRRRGREEDLCRVAEIVMVLSAMVEMRAGKEPTPAEQALAAEARERLARACEEVRPKDLFSSEAVRVLVEDLGLNRSKDPLLTFRPPKMSIAERVLHTKKKMEESRDFSSSTHVSQPHSISFAPSSESHGSQRFIAGKSSPMVLTAGGFPNNSSSVHIPGPASSVPSMKQTPTSELHSALVKSSFGKDSPSAACSIEAVNQRLDARINGPSYFTLVRPTVVANYLPEKASVSGISTSAALAAHSQANNLLVNHEIKVLQASQQMMKIHDTKGSVVPTTQASMAIGNQPSQGLTFVPVTSFTGNHSEIAKSILSVVQPRVPDCPNLPPPSAEYMTRPLNCQVCKLTITDVESLLVCDACEKGTHLKCFQPHGAKAVPKADWYCQKCLSTSNGKQFPPKYGRVTRQITAVKTTSSGGGTILSEKNWENPEPKLNYQKPAVNESLSSSGVAKTSNMLIPEDVSRESNVSNRKKIEEAYSNWKKPGEGMNSGTSVNHLEENSQLASTTPAAPSGNTDSQAARISSSEAEALEPFVSDSQSRSPDRQPSQSLSTSEIQTSVCENMPDLKTEPEILCSNQKHEIDVAMTSQSHLPSDLLVSKETNIPIIAESTDNLMQKTSMPITDELEDTSQSRNSDRQPSQSLSTSEIQTSVCEYMPDIKTQPEFLCSNQQHEIGVSMASQSHLPSDLQVTKETNVPIIAESTDNLMQKTSMPITDDLEDTSQSRSSDRQPSQSLSTSEIQTSVCENMPDIKTQPEFLCSNQEHEIGVAMASQSHLPSDLQVTEETNVPIIAESTDKLMLKTSMPITDELEDTSQSRSSDRQPSQSLSTSEIPSQSLSTSEIQTSVCENMPYVKTQPEYLCSNQKREIGVAMASQSHLPSDMQITKETNVPIISEYTDNLMQKTSMPITYELEDTSKSSEASTSQVQEVKVEGEHGSELIHDQIHGNMSDMACCGNSSVEVLYKFDWVGDIIEVLDDRTYYSSCCINGCIIKLQDNVIVSMDNQNFYPAKLLSLWEDNKVSSKLALVNEYCFPGTLPESVMQPSTPIQDEVYASDKISTILASSIYGLCNVLPEDKFREESGTRTFSADKADDLNSIFLCKWKFDKTNGIFQCHAQFI